MSHVAYPSTFDLGCAKYVLDQIKNRTFMENKQKFAFCMWNVAGYLLKLTLGAPPDDEDIHAGAMPSSIVECTHEDKAVLSELGKEIESFMSEPQSLTDENPSEGIDFLSLLLTYLPMILQLINSITTK